MTNHPLQAMVVTERKTFVKDSIKVYAKKDSDVSTIIVVWDVGNLDMGFISAGIAKILSLQRPNLQRPVLLPKHIVKEIVTLKHYGK